MFNWLKKKTPKPTKEKRSYQGAIHNRLTSDWITSGTSADSEIQGSLRTLRNRSRDLVRNNDYAKNAIRTITNNVIGKGISLQSQVRTRRGEKLDERINQEIEDLWADWIRAEYCHTAGTLGFQEIEQLIIKSLIESGEVLIRLVKRSFAGSPVPLAIEIIESDQLADEYAQGGDKRLGIEVNEWQRPVAYWLYPHHPGDNQFSSRYTDNRLLRVDADQIIHLFICDRPGQSRGVPWFHSALLRLRNIGGYEEAEIVAARAQASVMGFIQSPDSDFFGQGENGQRISKLAPGAIETLQPGEIFSGFAPTRPNQGFDPFVRCMLRGVAAGIGVSYEALSRDYSNTSYSSARTAMIDERDGYRVLQTWLIRKFHHRVFKEWLEMAYLSNALSLPGYEVKPQRFLKDKWVARGWQWVDPQSEVEAYKEAIKAGFTTISEVVAQTGQDVEDVFKERRRELDLAEQMELKFDTEFAGEGEEQVNQDTASPTTSNKEQVTSNKEEVVGEEQGTSNKEQVTSEEEKVDLQSMFGGRSHNSLLVTSYSLLKTEERAKNCKKGKACGNSCISKAKQCRKGLTPAATAASNNPVAKNAGKTPTPKASGKKGGKKQGRVTDGEALASAIATRDFKAAIDLGDKIYEKAGARAAAAGGDFYTGIQQGNISTRDNDWILRELWSDRGYEGKPQQLTASQFNRAINPGDIVAYRAMGSTNDRFKGHFDNFKNGDYFAGRGIYGHGTYVTHADANDKVARAMARSFASISASGYGSGMMRMNLGGMRITTQSAQEKELQKFKKDFDTWAKQERKNAADKREFDRQVRRTKNVMFGDEGNPGSGRFATLQGYDAINLDLSYNSSYMLLLNRSKVKVQKTSIKKNSI